MCAGAIAADLIATGIVHPSRKSNTSPSRELLLGSSLEKALETFGTSDNLKFEEDLTQLRDVYIEKKGKNTCALTILDFVNDVLVPMIKRTQHKRKKLLNSMAEAMENYAGELKA